MSPLSQGGGGAGGGGGGGGSTLVFSSVLSAPGAFDTTAALPGTFAILEIFALVQTTVANFSGSILVTLNADGGTNYDRQILDCSNATLVGAVAAAQTSLSLVAHGAQGNSSYASVIRGVIPGYAGTTFFKTLDMSTSRIDSTAADCEYTAYAAGWRSTSAINRIQMAAGSGSIATGSGLWIYGR